MYFVLKDVDDTYLTYVCIYINPANQETLSGSWVPTLKDVLSDNLQSRMDRDEAYEVIHDMYTIILKAETLEELKLLILLEE